MLETVNSLRIGGGRLFNCTEVEKNLIVAIIKQGFLDLHSKKQKLRDDAAAWLQSEDAYCYAEILGLDGEVLMRGVKYHLQLAGVSGNDSEPSRDVWSRGMIRTGAGGGQLSELATSQQLDLFFDSLGEVSA